MDLYRAIKQDPVRAWSIFESYPSTKHDYYTIRNNKKVSQLDLIEGAARTLYLNRTCFRGWWRYNVQGQFNVGYGGQGRRWAITEEDLVIAPIPKRYTVEIPTMESKYLSSSIPIIR